MDKMDSQVQFCRSLWRWLSSLNIELFLSATVIRWVRGGQSCAGARNCMFLLTVGVLAGIVTSLRRS